jgi:hypothetical protein
VEEQINAISAGDDLAVVNARLFGTIATARAEALQERAVNRFGRFAALKRKSR